MALSHNNTTRTEFAKTPTAKPTSTATNTRPVDRQNKSTDSGNGSNNGNATANGAAAKAMPASSAQQQQQQHQQYQHQHNHHQQQQLKQSQHVEVLLNNFQIKKKRYRVLLNDIHLVWERLHANKAQRGDAVDDVGVKGELARNNGATAAAATPTTTAKTSTKPTTTTTTAANKKETEYETEQLAHKAAYGMASHVVHINEIIRVDKSDSPKLSRSNSDSGAGSGNGNVNRVSTPPMFTINAQQQQQQQQHQQRQSMQSMPSPPPTEQYLIINYAERIVKSQSDCNRWRVQQLILYNADAYIVRQWHGRLNALLAQLQPARVQRLLVFINPYGGRKQALQTYERHCKPLFQLAGIDASCIISQRANQIRDILMTHDLTPYDAVCCVGGDGTVAEVINGLLWRTLSDLQLDLQQPAYIPKPRLPMALIPAGSTDTVAYSVHGTEDARTAAIHLVLGQRRGLDVCSVRNGQGIIRFCASVLSYGYLGDVARKSEQYRWMGTSRYEYAGVQAFLLNRGYEAELRLLEPEEVDGSGSSDALSTLSGDTVCYANCQRCSTSMPEHLVNLQRQQSANDDGAIAQQQQQQFDLDFESGDVNNDDCDTNTQPTVEGVGEDGVVLRNNKQLLNNDSQQSGGGGGDGGRRGDIDADNGDRDSIGTTSSSTSNGGRWKVIKGKFFMINGANIKCACARSPNGISRYNHLSDGTMELIIVRSTTHFNNFRFLINTMGHNGDIRSLPFVEVYRTKRFVFRLPNGLNCDDYSIRGSCQPIVNTATTTGTTSTSSGTQYSSWNCDGEVVTDLDIVMSSHCQLIDVFMRGPYAYHKPTGNGRNSENGLLTCCCCTKVDDN